MSDKNSEPADVGEGFVVARMFFDPARPRYKAVAIRSFDDGDVIIMESPESIRALASWLLTRAQDIEAQEEEGAEG